MGSANTVVVREDILKPAREGVLLQEEPHYSCNREEEEAEEPRIRNNDNSNHSTAVCSDSGVCGYTHVEDAGAAEEGAEAEALTPWRRRGASPQRFGARARRPPCG